VLTGALTVVCSSYAIHVSYQLAGNGSNGLTKGVLVHFSEDMADNLTAPSESLMCDESLKDVLIVLSALTPWIALVSCDKNATNASMEEDIFTLARDKGAVSAVRIQCPHILFSVPEGTSSYCTRWIQLLVSSILNTLTQTRLIKCLIYSLPKA